MTALRLTVRRIQHHVAVHYGIDPALITSPRLARVLSRPRQVAYWLCSKLVPELSLPQLGHSFKRDHTTILHGIRRINDLRGHDLLVLDATDTLLAAIAAEVTRPDDVSLAVSAGQGVLDAFTLALNALVRRDPAGALALFRRWMGELQQVRTREEAP